MKRLHIIPAREAANGVHQVVRLLAQRDGDAIVTLDEALALPPAGLRGHDEIWVHGMWLPKEWRICRKVVAAGVPLVRMTHGSLSPVYLARQRKWLKRLVSPIEQHCFARTSRVVVTGPWEETWCRRWGLQGPFETLDVKGFFNLPAAVARTVRGERALHVLYLGRRHPLKGVHLLEAAARELASAVELRCESEVSGAALEAAWAWADLLCLPTFSENFGLVVAEALARGRRVVTTDGAPAWAGLSAACGVVIQGFCDGTDADRVRLLREALKSELGDTSIPEGK